MKTYYTYLWLREDGTPYYVGKGKGPRAYVEEGRNCPPPQDQNRILIQEFPDELSAFTAEKFLIAFYGRKDLGTGVLRNLTDGGEGAAGTKPSLETRKKMSTSHILRRRQFPRLPPTQATRLKISKALAGEKAPNFGKKLSAETRGKISAARKGKPLSSAHRHKMSVARKGIFPAWLPRGRQLGYVHSLETIRKLSEAKMGNQNGRKKRRIGTA